MGLLKIGKEWWWVLLFLMLSSIVFEQAMQRSQREYLKLYGKLSELTAAKEEALVKQEDLQLKVDSLSDPAWMELSLMKVLGLVPEGHVKVLFVESKSK
jgi:hypothetical protein